MTKPVTVFDADDYVTKPFDLEELLARIAPVLRRARHGVDELVLGAVTVDFRRLHASNWGEAVVLSHREFDVLRYSRSDRDTWSSGASARRRYCLTPEGREEWIGPATQ